MNKLRHDLAGAIMKLFIGLSNGALIVDDFTLSAFDSFLLELKSKKLEILHLEHLYKDGSGKVYI